MSISDEIINKMAELNFQEYEEVCQRIISLRIEKNNAKIKNITEKLKENEKNIKGYSLFKNEIIYVRN